MESFEKFQSIPIVESSIKSGLIVYNRVKNSNRFINWSLNLSENLTFALIESLKPALYIVEGPLNKIDSYGVKILESVEQKIPPISLPPQMLYWNTKEYVADHVVKPVLKRADSFGDIADHALNFANQALDKYLPITDENNKENGDDVNNIDEEGNHAVLAYRRGRRLSKKFKTRIGSHTATEIKALKKDVNILLYSIELIITKPTEAYAKFKELYAYLSEKEPDNQKRPTSLEQLLVLLIRESARKIVHLTNFVTKHVGKIPRKLRHSMQEFLHHIMYWTNTLSKMIQVERAQGILSEIHKKYDQIQEQTNNALERLAIFCSGRLLDAEKIQMTNRNRIYMRPTSINGLY